MSPWGKTAVFGAALAVAPLTVDPLARAIDSMMARWLDVEWAVAWLPAWPW